MPNQHLSEWLESPQGRYLLDWEQTRFDIAVADIFGYNAMQIGLPEHNFLRNSRMSWRFTCAVRGRAALLAEPYALPIASASLDLVLLPHVLEFSPHPHQLLREVERVLVAEGTVLITGFNPFSLWGLRRMVASRRSGYPWKGHYFSVMRIRDWLTLLGFETQDSRFGCFRPAVSSAKWIERWRFMDHAGVRWWPVCGGVYMLQGIKRVQGMRLITPNWRDLKAVDKRLAPVVRRGRRVAGGVHRNGESGESGENGNFRPGVR